MVTAARDALIAEAKEYAAGWEGNSDPTHKPLDPMAQIVVSLIDDAVSLIQRLLTELEEEK